MSGEPVLRNLFDRWERVWHEGRYDLVPDCVAPHYIRHDEAGDRTVTENRAWYRFTMKWTDQGSSEVRTRAGMQAYRIEGGKLAETWVTLQPLGSSWGDAVAQESWTSQPPMN